MKHYNATKELSFTSIILLTTTFVFLFVSAMAALYISYLKPYVRYTCSDFTSQTYDEVVVAYNSGQIWLDGNGNGIPCESLAPLSITAQ